MTNWMTAAGIALIAGGLATLIGFRRALWAGNRRRRARAPQAMEQSRRSARAPQTARPAESIAAPVRIRTILPAQAGAPEISGAQQAADILAELAASREAPSSRRGRRRRPAEGRQGPAERRRPVEDDDEWSGLAEIGLADDDPADHGRSAEQEIDEPRNDEPAEEFEDDVDGTWAALDDAALNEVAPDAAAVDDATVDDAAVNDAMRGDAAEPIYADEPDEAAGDAVADHDPDEPLHRRLARGVLARADAGSREGARFDLASGQLVRPGDPKPEVGQPGRKARPGTNRPDRVQGWVRPRYDEAVGSLAGDYWKPVPASAYADLDETGAYGWPVPVERLPAAPAYPPPASGFDPIEESEPTAVVPQWPPARPSDRIEHPRTWSVRRGDDAAATEVRRRDDGTATHNPRDGWRHLNGPDAPKRRPRPRPNPAAEARSTVYVSRHAAEPS